METGRPLVAPATPPRGGDTKHVILSGAGSATARALLALRPRAAAPGRRGESRPPRGAAGTARAEGRGGGSRAARPGALGSLLPHRSRAGREEGRRGAAERVSGPRGERHRHLFARLKPARARRSERVRLLPAGWAVARAVPARPLLPLLLSAKPGSGSARRGPRPGPLRAGPALPRGGRSAASGTAGGRGAAPLRRALSVHSCLPPLLPGCPRQQLPPRDTHTLTPRHTNPFLLLPGT